MERNPRAGLWNLGSAVLALAMSHDGRWLAAACDDGVARLLPVSEGSAAPRQMKLHDGATLCLAAGFGNDDFVAGGEDGRLVAFGADGAVRELAMHQGQWIEQLAVAKSRGIAFYGVGKSVGRVRADGTALPPWPLPSTCGGLAVHPQEKRLAVAHYNGCSVYPLVGKHADPLVLPWQGSHLAALWHPAGEIVVTAMQEPALHGWRLSDKHEMRMSGYASRIESFNFVEGGRFLATAGSPEAICWPFFGGGPWGKAPLQVGAEPTGALVARVAAHPGDPLLALGYDNGALALAPLHEGNPLPLLPPGLDRLAHLIWSSDGRNLYAGTEGGALHLFTLDSVSAAYG